MSKPESTVRFPRSKAKKKAAKQHADAHSFHAGETPNSASQQASVEDIRADYLQKFSTLWQQAIASSIPSTSNPKFTGNAWQSTPLHAFNAALYALNAESLIAMVNAIDVSTKDRQKIRFAIEQWISATSPANYLFSNPNVLQNILKSSGESLTAGIVNLLRDLRQGHISQSDETAFEIGKNIAMTEGAVVYENEIFQLLQYTPSTPAVYRRPLLVAPPCINKYYILDLQRHNSFVRYAVEQGHTVFMISWRNADATMVDATWDQYIVDGIVRAIKAVQQISKQSQINLLGFCIGGTMLSHALAWMTARGEHPAASLTLLTTLLDFAEPGILDVYIDEQQIAAREKAIGQGGLMKGRDFSAAFSTLRPDDLIWHFVEANYLQGKLPQAFDLLYWNADSTNLPGPMFCWYLRNTYLENNLKVPGRLALNDVSIDLGAIDAPTFIYASQDDHIVPWQSAYASTAILNRRDPAQNHFVLGASGHVAGVVNPPSANKRHHWVNPHLNDDPTRWLDDANQIGGSWWSAWAEFAQLHAGDHIDASPQLGNRQFKPIELAPGRYVKVKAG